MFTHRPEKISHRDFHFPIAVCLADYVRASNAIELLTECNIIHGDTHHLQARRPHLSSDGDPVSYMAKDSVRYE